MKFTTLMLAAGSLLALASTSSSAMPVSNLAQAAPSDVENARVVCRRGYCYRTARRYYRPYGYGGYAPYAYRPYGYARPYGYGYGGPYGYGRPYGYGGYGYGRPGLGFSFRF
jgi:hypothetical protein